MVAAVITGITKATSQSLNRLAKLEARQAYGFRNPLNQQRRVASPAHQSRCPYITKARTVTEPEPHPDLPTGNLEGRL